MGAPKAVFRFDLSPRELAHQLARSLQAYVIGRGREFNYTQDLMARLEQVAVALTEPSYRFGIMLSGSYGNGKTSFLYAIRTLFHSLWGTAALASLPRNFKTEVPIVSAKKICQDIIKGDDSYESYDLLMIDDLGDEPSEIINYGMVYTPIVDLLLYRYQQMKYTIISTNLKMEQFRPTYGHRIADRFEEMMHFFVFDNDSYRQ